MEKKTKFIIQLKNYKLGPKNGVWANKKNKLGRGIIPKLIKGNFMTPFFSSLL